MSDEEVSDNAMQALSRTYSKAWNPALNLSRLPTGLKTRPIERQKRDEEMSNVNKYLNSLFGGLGTMCTLSLAKFSYVAILILILYVYHHFVSIQEFDQINLQNILNKTVKDVTFWGEFKLLWNSGWSEEGYPLGEFSEEGIARWYSVAGEWFDDDKPFAIFYDEQRPVKNYLMMFLIPWYQPVYFTFATIKISTLIIHRIYFFYFVAGVFIYLFTRIKPWPKIMRVWIKTYFIMVTLTHLLCYLFSPLYNQSFGTDGPEEQLKSMIIKAVFIQLRLLLDLYFLAYTWSYQRVLSIGATGRERMNYNALTASRDIDSSSYGSFD